MVLQTKCFGRCASCFAVWLLLLWTTCTQGAPSRSPAQPALARAMASLRIPPAWWDDINPRYDMNTPWKQARLEIRRRLALGDQRSLREAMKLTVLYAQKKDIGDGHELPMYLFIGGEHAWAVKEYRKYLAPFTADPQKRGGNHAFVSLAACYQHFGEYDKAVATCNAALKHLAGPPMTEMNAAATYAKLGDVHADAGRNSAARECYEKAIANFKVAKPKYGRHLLPQRISRVQSRIDLLSLPSVRLARLRDGTYRARALGYNGPLTVITAVKRGRIADVRVDHNEKIELGSTSIIPRRIVEKQDLHVDAVTAATVTSQAIVEGALNGLKQAGLRTK